MGIVQNLPPFRNHWTDLTDLLQRDPQNKTHLIGGANLSTQMYKVKLAKVPSEMSMSSEQSDSCNLCMCIPPCECNWLEQQYELPGVLTCLLNSNKIPMTDVASGDVVVVAENDELIDKKNENNNQEVETMATNVDELHTNCCCVLPYECQWHKERPKYNPILLTILRCANEVFIENTDLSKDKN